MEMSAGVEAKLASYPPALLDRHADIMNKVVANRTKTIIVAIASYSALDFHDVSLPGVSSMDNCVPVAMLTMVLVW